MTDSKPDDCLERAVVERVAEGVERRHEALLEWATVELGMERGAAEQVYALAEEERLEPVYAFQLVRCGRGVRNLLPTTAASAEASTQQEPPAWVVPEGLQLSDIERERRLRQSFRRFRGLLESTDDPVLAARAYVAEPDVGPIEIGPSGA